MAKRIVILGAGESGAGAAVLAKKQGFDTFVSDMSTIKDTYKNMLNERGIEWEEGKHTESLILNADEVIKSPGIPNDAPMILKLKSQGTPIISEIEFAGRYTNAKMICITGSNGKTTTTSLIYHIFKKAGMNVGLAGNILCFIQIICQNINKFTVCRFILHGTSCDQFQIFFVIDPADIYQCPDIMFYIRRC